MNHLFDQGFDELKQKGYFIAYLDGAKCPYLGYIVKEIGYAFHFPDYYGENWDALDECINDLDWIPEKNYALIILNSYLFLAKDTDEKKLYFWNFIESVRNEWASVPNHEGEEQYRDKADFVIIKK